MWKGDESSIEQFVTSKLKKKNDNLSLCVTAPFKMGGYRNCCFNFFKGSYEGHLSYAIVYLPLYIQAPL